MPPYEQWSEEQNQVLLIACYHFILWGASGWIKTSGLVYYYIPPQDTLDPDPTASEIGSVQLWGCALFTIINMGSQCVLMYSLPTIDKHY